MRCCSGFSIGLLLTAVISGCASSSSLAQPGFVIPAPGTATEMHLRIGDEFPRLEATDLDGNTVTIGPSLLGERYTLIIFWSTWCGFCMRELPHEIELARKYERQGLRVIGVNGDESAEIAKEAVRKHQVPWLNLFEGPDQTISDSLGIKQWPTLLLLDAKGKVRMASRDLRAISIEELPDGTDRQIDGLEWALRELFKNDDRTIEAKHL